MVLLILDVVVVADSGVEGVFAAFKDEGLANQLALIALPIVSLHLLSIFTLLLDV